MSEQIRITPEVLISTADDHDEVVRHVEAARDRGSDILAAVDSYGPIMHQVKAAVGDVLLDRDTALAAHAARHRNASDDLRKGAALYVSQDEQNAAQISQVPDA
ncbi:type VII secretion target (plasmid) [Mycolicibacterium aichiense]|uniref:type VII secretion target n=1 Tax=Mycolicibacterium aichiense TaxID=1799 RepID=UPI003D67A00D